jgi:cytochrome c-type biogenesis protein CcmH
MTLRVLLCAVLFLLSSLPAQAVQPNEMLKDPALEARARALSRNIRCLVCQNESIDDSHADLAHDLRVLIRERLTAGDTDQQVLDYLVSRYGDFVLLRPPLKSTTWLLWFGPGAILVIAAVGIGIWYRRRNAAGGSNDTPARLTAEERARLAELLDEGGTQP